MGVGEEKQIGDSAVEKGIWLLGPAVEKAASAKALCAEAAVHESHIAKLRQRWRLAWRRRDLVDWGEVRGRGKKGGRWRGRACGKRRKKEKKKGNKKERKGEKRGRKKGEKGSGDLVWI